jgi:uncharacterized protein (TIGR01777 family)
MSATTLIFRSSIPASADDVLAWHRNPGALERLTPPWMDVRILDAEGGIAPGDWARLRVPVDPAAFTWTLVHEALPDGMGFVDVQQAGPFRTWRHEHRFLPDGPNRSVLEDRIVYELPYGALGSAFADGRVRAQLARLFHFRHRRTRTDLARHLDAGLDRPLRIAVTGATGLVGSRLVPFLQTGGHEVFRLVRHDPRDDHEIFWDPATSQIDAAALEGMDAVVHLAGVSIAGGRWTSSRKAAIRDSRVEGTHLLARTLAGLQDPPRVLVSTSAVGYYGNVADRFLTEESPAGEGFLANVCYEWEDAAKPATKAGIRVVLPRFGVVFAGEGGMLPLLARVFKAGIGGPLGDGKQYLSWIALDDLVGILLEAIANESLAGPVNAVAPEPVTNRVLGETLGRVLRRPAILRTPATMMRLAAGQLADELILASQRARPARLARVGFTFAYPTLDATLRHELGREDGRQPSPAITPRRRGTVEARSGAAVRIPVQGNGAAEPAFSQYRFSTRTQEGAPHGRPE